MLLLMFTVQWLSISIWISVSFEYLYLWIPLKT